MRALANLVLLEITLFVYLDVHELWPSMMSICLVTEVAMGYVSTWMGDRFRALDPVSDGFALVDRNPFRPYYCHSLTQMFSSLYIQHNVIFMFLCIIGSDY